MVAWKQALRVGFLMGLLGMGQSVLAETEIVVKNLLGEHAITDPLPLYVELRHAGAPIRGQLEWQNSPTLRQHLSIELTHGARKGVHVAIPLNAWGQEQEGLRRRSASPVLLWRTESGSVRQLEIAYRWVDCLPVVVIGNYQGGFERWRKAQFEVKHFFEAQKVQSDTWSLEPVYWLPRAVPTNYESLLGIPLIILTEGSESLASEQWEALLGWLLAGGHLIVSVGSIGTPLQGTPLAPLLPPIGGRTTLTVPVNSQQGTEPQPIPMIQSSGWSDVIAQVWEGPILVSCSRRVGCGTLTLCFADMQASAWRSWQGYERLINHWCRLLDIPLQNLREPLNKRSLRSPIERGWVARLAGVFALFWVGLYLSWRILRRRRRLIYAPLALVALVGLTLGLTTQMTPALHNQKRSKVKRTLIANQSLPIALEHCFYHALLPAGEYSLQSETEFAMLALECSGGGVSFSVAHGASPTVAFQALRSVEIQMQTTRLLRLPAPVGVSQSASRYTVLNPFDVPMEAVQVVHRKGARITVQGIAPEVAPKATVSGEPMAVPDARQSPPQNGEWLTAILRGLPSPLKPLPDSNQQEPVRLWLRIR